MMSVVGNLCSVIPARINGSTASACEAEKRRRVHGGVMQGIEGPESATWKKIMPGPHTFKGQNGWLNTGISIIG